MSRVDDIISVSSSSDDSFDEAMFARAKDAPGMYNGTAVIGPDTGTKTVLVTGGAGFIGSHVSGEIFKARNTVESVFWDSPSKSF